MTADRGPRNFALTGAAGYVAPRHLKAIRDTGNQLVAAVDPHDAVGVLDRYSLDVRFFTEIERFDRHLEKLRRGPESERVHYVSICSPNYLHDAHIRLALRAGADVICEKPLVINPWNLDALESIERETGRRVNTVLQLRLHPELIALRERLAAGRGKDGDKDLHDVSLTYVTARGRWYDVSWKGSAERSGGIVVNIGIHLFDLLLWLFGGVVASEVHTCEPRRIAGYLQLERARVRWFLSTDIADLPAASAAGARTTFRSIAVDGGEIEFSDGFTDLHTRVYEEAQAGRGFGIADSRPAIELAYRIKTATPEVVPSRLHPFAAARL
jgi:UDP-N-acetyl-2-amino-2-deoxyglucuronate dehydrogenase